MGARAKLFCGEVANSLSGYAREGIFGSGEAASEIPACIQLESSPFFSRLARLFALVFGTEVRAGTHSRRLRRLGFEQPSQEFCFLAWLNLLLVFTYHVIKPKNRNHSVNKVTNKGYDR